MLQVLGVVWWLGTILLGYLVDSISPLPAVLFWIGIWIGLPIAAVVLGNPWPSLSPFRTIFGALERVARLDRPRAAGRRPPPTRARLGRWPAAALLFAALWAELVLPESETPITVANLLLGYTVLTLLGMLLFGRVAWLRNAELFEVLLGWFGRIGPDRPASGGSERSARAAPRMRPGALRRLPRVRGRPRSRASVAAELRPWFAGPHRGPSRPAGRTPASSSWRWPA